MKTTTTQTTPYRVVETTKETYEAMGKDDILYGFILSIATTTKAKEEQVFTPYRSISKKEWTKRGGFRKQVCQLFGGCETRKINRAVERLIENGLIEEDKDYYFINESLIKSRYVKIDIDLLTHMCCAYSTPALKIYCYLRWKDYCASTHNDNKNRIFTINKMIEDMGGIGTSRSVRETFIHCLGALQAGGIIEFHIEKRKNENGGYMEEIHYLDKIAYEIPTKTAEYVADRRGAVEAFIE